MQTVVVDNGAGKVKYGFAGEDAPRSMSNCIGRMQKSMTVLIGDQMDANINGSLFTISRPFDRGYLVSWQVEVDVWSRMLTNLSVVPSSCNILVTEPLLNPVSMQNDMNEIVRQ